jgi:hypothetical protein
MRMTPVEWKNCGRILEHCFDASNSFARLKGFAVGSTGIAVYLRLEKRHSTGQQQKT